LIKTPWFLYLLLLIVYDPERMESPKQLILFQAIIIPFPVQKGFKDKHAARLEAFLKPKEISVYPGNGWSRSDHSDLVGYPRCRDPYR
jgi:hypothetical protein